MRSVQERGDESKDEKGVFIDALTKELILEIRTRNTLYTVTVKGGKDVLAKGGHYFPEEAEATLVGSTWGGTMIRTGFIGIGMCLELWSEKTKTVVTTVIRNIKIISPNGDWDYTL